MTFERYEIKYALCGKSAAEAEKAIARFASPDRFGESEIRNVYFDTPDNRVILRSTESPPYKEKLRSRCYGNPGAGGEVFFELKKKYLGKVFKRRILAPEKETWDFVKSTRDDQIAREIKDFYERYQTVAPSIFISYRRRAYFARDGSGIRITFDRDILYRTENLSLGMGGGKSLFPDGDTVIVEVKTGGGVPLWLLRVLSDAGAVRISFSKCGEALKKIIGGM